MKLVIIKIIIKIIMLAITLLAGVGALKIRKRLEDENVSVELKIKILSLLASILTLSVTVQMVSIFMK